MPVLDPKVDLLSKHASVYQPTMLSHRKYKPNGTRINIHRTPAEIDTVEKLRERTKVKIRHLPQVTMLFLNDTTNNCVKNSEGR